jgi:Tfp pilus assembly protein PilF
MPEAEARYTLARILAENQQVDLARQQLELAVRVDPSFAPAQEALARINPLAQPQPTTERANPVVQTMYQHPAAGHN